jgi:hypothetical protein
MTRDRNILVSDEGLFRIDANGRGDDNCKAS